MLIYVMRAMCSKAETFRRWNMPRNIKCRRVCREPENRIFSPENGCADYITLSVEELDAVEGDGKVEEAKALVRPLLDEVMVLDFVVGDAPTPASL